MLCAASISIARTQLIVYSSRMVLANTEDEQSTPLDGPLLGEATYASVVLNEHYPISKRPVHVR